MNVIVLAAGYATRLGELTRNFPKPLLEVGGRTILDHLMERVREIDGVEGVYLVTNSRFASHFETWRSGLPSPEAAIHIVDDGTDSNDNRLGAIGDIRFVLREHAHLREADLFVCASDNILEFSLADFVETIRKRKTAGICVRRIDDPDDLRRRGIAELDENDRVTRFVEKPEHPQSNWAAPPIYYYPASVLHRIDAYLDNGGNPDAPGHFVEWLCSVEPISAYRAPGAVVDIGNPRSLEDARTRFEPSEEDGQ